MMEVAAVAQQQQQQQQNGSLETSATPTTATSSSAAMNLTTTAAAVAAAAAGAQKDAAASKVIKGLTMPNGDMVVPGLENGHTNPQAQALLQVISVVICLHLMVIRVGGIPCVLLKYTYLLHRIGNIWLKYVYCTFGQ